MILNSPPQFGQRTRSISNTRLGSLAQLRRTGRWYAQLGIRGHHAVEANQVQPRPGHQRLPVVGAASHGGVQAEAAMSSRS